MGINDEDDELENTADSSRASASGDGLRGTSVRPVGRAFAATVPLWMISPEGKVVYVSPACASWLHIAPSQLADRSVFPEKADAGSIAGGMAARIDHLDLVAQALAPPTRPSRQASCVWVHPPQAPDPQRAPVPPVATAAREPQAATASREAHAVVEPREVTFVPLPLEDNGFPYVLAIASRVLPSDNTPHPATQQWLGWVRAHLAAEPRHGQSPLVMGDSVWALRLRSQIALAVANPSAHVLLFGPRGSGCLSIAQLIYGSESHAEKHSAKTSNDLSTPTRQASTTSINAAPMVRVAGPLMDAELFEATTGDVVRRYLESTSHRAGIIVEDIDQMPLDAQQRLTQLIEHCGNTLRVFATTALSPAELAQRIQPTLLAHLGGLEICIPSLANRHEDIPILASTLLQRRHLAGETPAHGLSRDLLDRLINYPWPGNFDELADAIRFAARQCMSHSLQWEHLPIAIRTYGAISDETPPVAPKPQTWLPLDQALENFESEQILRALQQTTGNRAAAARLLQISRPRLLRRIEQLNIQWPPTSE